MQANSQTEKAQIYKTDLKTTKLHPHTENFLRQHFKIKINISHKFTTSINIPILGKIYLLINKFRGILSHLPKVSLNLVICHLVCWPITVQNQSYCDPRKAYLKISSCPIPSYNLNKVFASFLTTSTKTKPPLIWTNTEK